MIGPQEVHGMHAEALATLEEAMLHAYSPQAALWAALAHLEGASADQASFVAALLASWLTTHLNPTVAVTDLPEWLGEAAKLAARNWT